MMRNSRRLAAKNRHRVDHSGLSAVMQTNRPLHSKTNALDGITLGALDMITGFYQVLLDTCLCATVN